MVVAQSEALAERPDLNFGVVVGGDGGIACGLEKTEGGKCTEPRKLDKKLSGFYYDKKTQLQGSVEVHEDAGERLQH